MAVTAMILEPALTDTLEDVVQEAGLIQSQQMKSEVSVRSSEG
jgi:hypothetical protein